jgi:hypothetical protein
MSGSSLLSDDDYDWDSADAPAGAGAGSGHRNAMDGANSALGGSPYDLAGQGFSPRSSLLFPPYGAPTQKAPDPSSNPVGAAMQAFAAGADPDSVHPSARPYFDALSKPRNEVPQYGLFGSLDQIRAAMAGAANPLALDAVAPTSQPPRSGDAYDIGDGGATTGARQAAAMPAYRVAATAVGRGPVSVASPTQTPTALDAPEKTVVSSVQKALAAMGRPNDLSNVVPYTPGFAKVLDPAKFDTSGWKPEFSWHAGRSWEAPIPGYSNFVLKYYDDPKQGHVIAVVPPSTAPEHILLSIPSIVEIKLGMRDQINTHTAEKFLNSRPVKSK